MFHLILKTVGQIEMIICVNWYLADMYCGHQNLHVHLSICQTLFNPKQHTLHSTYTFYQFNHSLVIKHMPCATVWATMPSGKPPEVQSGPLTVHWSSPPASSAGSPAAEAVQSHDSALDAAVRFSPLAHTGCAGYAVSWWLCRNAHGLSQSLCLQERKVVVPVR